MPKTNLPSYRLHKASGQAFIELDGRRFYLGKYGSKASKVEYERRLGEYLSNPDISYADSWFRFQGCLDVFC